MSRIDIANKKLTITTVLVLTGMSSTKSVANFSLTQLPEIVRRYQPAQIDFSFHTYQYDELVTRNHFNPESARKPNES